jgi:subtilisin family serine protease
VSLSRRVGRRRPAAALVTAAAAVTLLAVMPAGSAGAAPKSTASDLYVVQLKEAPAVQYAGGVSGIAATKPAPGAKLDTKAWNYNAYREHLRAKRAETLRKVKVDAKKTVAEYDTVVNGFAAKLTAAEVAKLRSNENVARVVKNDVFKLNTVSTPRFLGLDGAGGAWSTQFGNPARAGEGVIVGVIDTGIWPESPSFAALPEPRPDADRIAAKWQGECQAGNDSPVTCNNKLIGARFYNFGSVPPREEEFDSPRDYDGHGSHTASTAAGNHNVPAVINGVEVGRASGMAPAARVAAYKVCYQKEDGSGSCGGIEIVAAVDDAIADGVDVINFSISGSTSSITDLTESAFFNAAAAGVFVSTSAGNEGPAPNTVAHNGPWTTTVAASTHDRSFTKSVTLGNGQTYTGAGIGPAVPSAPLIDSVNAGQAGTDPTEVQLCTPGTLDPARVTGKIVLCARGVVARTDKSLAVKQAGGVGMVLYNPTPNSLNADFHHVPTVHVGPVEGAAIKAYIAATTGATASMSAAAAVRARAPEMAAFSSNGEAIAGSGDLLKPDITAPGVDVIAAVSPAGQGGNLYNALSGTSMSSPHVAGLAALLRSKNPTWTPMAVKSALMTTATTADNSGAPIQRDGHAASPLDYGAGHVRPGPAFNPGIVYESTPFEWTQYTCGIGEHQLAGSPTDQIDLCDITGSIDPSNVNNATISVGDVAGRQTITRTVTNTTRQASVYFPKIEVPAGYTVTVSPSALTVLPSKSASYTVEVTRTTAAKGEWKFGSLTWSDLRGHSARSALALRAADVAAVTQVSTLFPSGSQKLQVQTAYTGTLTAKPFGLVGSTVSTKHLVGVVKDFNPAAPAEGPAVGKYTITVPAGTKVARFATFDKEYPSGTDLDMYVYKDGVQVGTSGSGSAEEGVTVTAAGTYEVYVTQFSLAGGRTEQDVNLHSFLVGDTAVGNLTATPASQSVTAGKAVTVTAAWSGLTAGRTYLGVIEYGNGSAALDQTVFLVRA